MVALSRPAQVVLIAALVLASPILFDLVSARAGP
jgi:hypothetical protein